MQEFLLATLLSFGTFNPLSINCIVGLWLEATCDSGNFFGNTFFEGNCMLFLIEFGIFLYSRVPQKA